MATVEGGSRPLSNSVNLMPITEMYKVATRASQAWGIDGYEVPRKYQHPPVDAEQVKNKNKVSDEDKKKFKKGDYLSNDLKRAENMPAPNAYTISKPWITKEQQETMKARKVKYGDRITAAAEIFKNCKDKEGKFRGVPGVGTYTLRKKPEDETKALIEEGKKHMGAGKNAQRQNFLCEYEYVADKSPGPGQYYPNPIMPKLHPNSQKPEDFIKKEAEKRKTIKADKDKGKVFDGLEYNPHPVLFGTFSKLQQDLKDKDKAKSIIKEKSLGTSQRWLDDKKQKERDAKYPIPGPGHYPLVAQWPGKPENSKSKDKGEKTKNWMNTITKGTTKSIYYS